MWGNRLTQKDWERIVAREIVEFFDENQLPANFPVQAEACFRRLQEDDWTYDKTVWCARQVSERYGRVDNLLRMFSQVAVGRRLADGTEIPGYRPPAKPSRAKAVSELTEHEMQDAMLGYLQRANLMAEALHKHHRIPAPTIKPPGEWVALPEPAEMPEAVREFVDGELSKPENLCTEVLRLISDRRPKKEVLNLGNDKAIAAVKAVLVLSRGEEIIRQMFANADEALEKARKEPL